MGWLTREATFLAALRLTRASIGFRRRRAGAVRGRRMPWNTFIVKHEARCLSGAQGAGMTILVVRVCVERSNACSAARVEVAGHGAPKFDAGRG